MGFEPTTFGLEVQRAVHCAKGANGLAGIRTRNLRFKVLGANHYTTGPTVVYYRLGMHSLYIVRHRMRAYGVLHIWYIWWVGAYAYGGRGIIAAPTR